VATGASALTLGAVTSQASAASFEVGQRVSPKVWTDTYVYPNSNSKVMATVSPDDAGYIEDGPSSDPDQTFYLVAYNNAPNGWTSATNLEPESASEDQSASGATIIENVPYFWQYNNRLQPSGSCQNTCLAMLLKYYGWSSADPDKITKLDGTQAAQTPSGAARVFNNWASYYGLGVRASGTRTGTYEDLTWYVDQGRPPMVNGWMTEYGHLVTVVGYTDSEVICNDPAGVWNGGFNYRGDHSGSDGAYVRYDKDAFLDAVAAPNGNGNIYMMIPDEPR
jgi:hypothetical protein